MAEDIKLETVEREPAVIFPRGVSRELNKVLTVWQFDTVYKKVKLVSTMQ